MATQAEQGLHVAVQLTPGGVGIAVAAGINL
jgi:hypothetical protein